MSTFIEWLEERQREDTRVRAALKRSLAFEPGTHVPAFPWVEPFLVGNENTWRRKVHHLVAGLWALHWREGESRPVLPLGVAAATFQNAMDAAGTERRFIALLDADEEQLPHRLRQLVALLKDYPLDFEAMLTDLLRWNNESKRTQNEWARDFYRTLTHDGAEFAASKPSEEKP
nr:type I-E CRISPR-associated protein Cse2/CasB [uncultured Holophaga sp.]